MLPEEIVRKIRIIDIRTKLLVDQMFSGEYQSVFKGRGIEFSEVREYAYGDDTRSIDWNVTARYGKPFLKVYEEERELTVLILFDMSASTLFGSRERTKRDLMSELAALFSFSAVENNDRVGAVLFSDRIEKYIPPKKDKTHALRILRELVYFKPEAKRTDLKAALDFINTLRAPRSVVFILSDFFTGSCDKQFKVTAKKHDVIPVVFTDPLEEAISNHRGILLVKDSETGERRYVDLADPGVRNGYSSALRRTTVSWKRLFMSIGLDYIEVPTSGPYMKRLFEFFERRARKL
jgi:uncharacterized protein (DUF58 family)